MSNPIRAFASALGGLIAEMPDADPAGPFRVRVVITHHDGDIEALTNPSRYKTFEDALLVARVLSIVGITAGTTIIPPSRVYSVHIIDTRDEAA